jgi:hypothetical protein
MKRARERVRKLLGIGTCQDFHNAWITELRNALRDDGSSITQA